MDELQISPNEAAERLGAGNAILLDVVTDSSWHVLREVPKGALRIPPQETSSRSNEIPSGPAVIALCT